MQLWKVNIKSNNINIITKVKTNKILFFFTVFSIDMYINEIIKILIKIIPKELDAAEGRMFDCRRRL